MIKKECMIVRDLFPNYIEELISVETNEFIQEHINNCSECREILEAIQNERNETNNLRKNYEKIEYNHLKKYNKKMLILKNIILMIVLICLILLGNFLFKIYRINNIIQASYSKINESVNLSNYKINVKEYIINFKDNTESNYTNNIYFIDNKYKEEVGTSSYYGKINSNKRISIYEELKRIDNETANYNYETKESIMKKNYTEISSEAKLKGVWCIWRNAKVKVRNDRFNGKTCYVLRYQDIKDDYKEIWIDKKTMFPVKILQDNFDSYYSEKIITLSTDVVTNSDVEVPVKEGYSIKESITELSDEDLKIMEEVRNKF